MKNHPTHDPGAQNSRAILEGSLGPELLKFGAPLGLALGLQACFNLIDMLIIGQLPNGVPAIGALAICDMIAVLGTIMVHGISIASAALVARAFGNQDTPALSRTTWNSLHLVLGLSFIFGLFGTFCADIIVIRMMGASGAVGEIGASYFQILVGNSWTIFFLLHLTTLMRAMGSAKWPAVILIGANILNILLDVLLVYGPGPAPDLFAWGAPVAALLGLPRMEVDGAAWATVIARSLGCIASFMVLFLSIYRAPFKREYLKPVFPEIRKLISLALPSSGQLVVRIVGVLFAISLINRFLESPLNEEVLAAYGICIRLETIVLFTSLGWGGAVATFVGANLGANSPQRAFRAGVFGCLFSALSVTLIAGIYLRFPETLMALFLLDESVISEGSRYLAIVALTYPLVSIAVVLSNAIQGAAETITSLIIDAVIVCLFQAPVMFLGLYLFSGSSAWIWASFAAANLISALAYAAYYKTKKWVPENHTSILSQPSSS